jgi:osmotically-inducible protein OsmY
MGIDLEVSLPPAGRCSDEKIAGAVAEVLASHASSPPSQVEAQVSQARVTLEGTVEWHYQREAAEQTVRQLKDVQGVINRIVLRPTARAVMVQDRVKAAFKRSADLDARRTTVETRRHKVILRGMVRAWAEQEEAEQAAWSAHGEAAVANHLTVAV